MTGVCNRIDELYKNSEYPTRTQTEEAFGKMFGEMLGDLQLTQAGLADMATGIDAAALLVYRAAWAKDQGAPRVTREAAMAKMFATETAQFVIDRAVQIFGGMGVRKGVKVEELYREIRALRIYEGATEVQKVVIGRDLMKAAQTATIQRTVE
jgi:acyl-CoA dehydrogenase